MRAKSLRKVKPGDPITAAMWNELIDALNQADINVGQSRGLEIQQGPQGTALRVSDRQDEFLCVADGNISARSGSTPGTGNVKLVTLDGTTLATSNVSYPVYNPSATTMSSGHGIDSGQYCTIKEYPSGRYMVAPLECS